MNNIEQEVAKYLKTCFIPNSILSSKSGIANYIPEYTNVEIIEQVLFAVLKIIIIVMKKAYLLRE